MTMTENLGIGVMIQMLGGNEETVEALQGAVGKTIKQIEFTEDVLTLMFGDDIGITFKDEGQSCCESRYMTCDDDLPYFVGAKFTGAEIKEATSKETEWGEPHDIQFLLIHTSKGVFTIETHNEHNGYYGGFWIVIREV